MLFRGFRSELMNGPGFRTDHLVMMSFDPTLVRYGEAQTQQFYKQLSERARSIPGVQSAALVERHSDVAEPAQEAIVPEGYQLPKDSNSVSVFARHRGRALLRDHGDADLARPRLPRQRYRRRAARGCGE